MVGEGKDAQTSREQGMRKRIGQKNVNAKQTSYEFDSVLSAYPYESEIGHDSLSPYTTRTIPSRHDKKVYQGSTDAWHLSASGCFV
jgi:hypothetical protein